MAAINRNNAFDRIKKAALADASICRDPLIPLTRGRIPGSNRGDLWHSLSATHPFSLVGSLKAAGLF